MKTARLLALALLLLTAACSTPGIASGTPAVLTPAAPAARTDTPTPAPPAAQKVVEVRLSEVSSYSSHAEIDSGGTAHLRLSLAPVLMTITPGMVSSRPWQDADLTEMQVCFALDRPCSLDGASWAAYQAETLVDYPVDWIGSRLVHAAVKVRSSDGAIVPVVLQSGSAPSQQLAASFEVIAQINTRTPAEMQSRPIQTALAATRSAFPVSGSVVIEDGRCCAGGAAGSTVHLKVAFAANSPTAKVTEMRVTPGMGCQKDTLALNAPWEPFQASKEYTATLAINWTTWFISVQYRDEQGSLSPVYCSNIGLEGN